MTTQHRSSDPFVGLFYLLIRDHIPAGALEQVVVQVTAMRDRGKREAVFTNSHLGRYAEEIVQRLRATEVER